MQRALTMLRLVVIVTVAEIAKANVRNSGVANNEGTLTFLGPIRLVQIKETLNKLVHSALLRSEFGRDGASDIGGAETVTVVHEEDEPAVVSGRDGTSTAWSELPALVEPYYSKAGDGHRPVGIERMLRFSFFNSVSACRT
jgi:hypothetical protein